MNAREIGKIALVAAACTVFGVGAVYAATTTITASIKFVSDLTLTSVVASPNFGYVQAGTAGTYVLSTGGTVTPSLGGVTEGGTPAAADWLIKGSATQTITIFTSGYTPQGSSTPSLATCNYNGGGSQACDSPGISVAAPGAAGKHVLLGLKVVTTSGGTDGTTDTPSFTLNVNYN